MAERRYKYYRTHAALRPEDAKRASEAAVTERRQCPVICRAHSFAEAQRRNPRLFDRRYTSETADPGDTEAADMYGTAAEAAPGIYVPVTETAAEDAAQPVRAAEPFLSSDTVFAGTEEELASAFPDVPPFRGALFCTEEDALMYAGDREGHGNAAYPFGEGKWVIHRETVR